MTTFEPGARLVFTQGLICRPRSTAFFASRPAPSITEGFEVLVQLVMAAMTTAPLERSNESPLLRTCDVLVAAHPSTTFVKRGFRVAQRDAILRALRSGDGRFDGGEIEFELVAE